MKLIPYTNLSNAVPAMALVAANVTVMYGPTVQLAAVLAVLLVAAPKLKPDLSPLSVALILYIAICLGAAVLSYGMHQAVVKAGKIALFGLVSMLAVRSATADDRFPALVALRALLGLCMLNFLYAIATGGAVFRGAYLIEFSIYSSYTIAILIYLARPHLTAFDRAAAVVFSVLCGSTMGLLLLILAELVGRRPKPRTLICAAALAPIGIALLSFLMQVRDKEFTWEFFATSDRALLLTTYVDTTLPTFSASDWLFGLGAGQPLHHFITPDSGFNGYILRLGEGEIFSFCLHNEPLRILTDFGMVGLLLIVARLWANCSGPVLFLLGVCMLTNSYIYSFSGALIASTLFNPKPQTAARAQRALAAGLQPA